MGCDYPEGTNPKKDAEKTYFDIRACQNDPKCAWKDAVIPLQRLRDDICASNWYVVFYCSSIFAFNRQSNRPLSNVVYQEIIAAIYLHHQSQR